MGEFEIGQLCQDLIEHYYSMCAGWELLRNPAGELALQTLEATNVGPAPVPIASVERNDGSAIWYHLAHFLRTARDDAAFQLRHSRMGLEMAIVTLADAVLREGGFDRGPDLEFLRHLRNAVAHGNRFELRGSEPTRPAHFVGFGEVPARFEITAALHGQVALFAFMGPGDVCDLIIKLGVRLNEVANANATGPV